MTCSFSFKDLEIMPCSHHIRNCSSNDQQHPPPRKNGSEKRPSGVSKSVFSDPELQISNLQSCPLSSIDDLVKVLEKDSKDLEAVSSFVTKHKSQVILWENSDTYLQLCDLSGTIYRGQKFMQKSWEDLYLDKETRMQVLGTLENSRVCLPCMDWIILVGEDGCIYAYEEDMLYLIAESFSEFIKNGESNILKSYSYPEYSDEDDEPLPQEIQEEIQKIRQRTRDFVDKSATQIESFLNFLSS